MRRFALSALAALAFCAPAHAESGAALYAENCSSCHGPRGEGIGPPGRPGANDVIGLGPSVTNAGAGTADFYLRTGYMPLQSPHDQPTRTRVLFNEQELRALVGYVASLGHGPPIPSPHPEQGSVSAGFDLFAQNCAGCHQIAAKGGYVTGARVPALTHATDVQIAEAVRAGPYLMPRFSSKQISDRELDSIIRYVDYTKAPHDPGGWSIGRIGPVPEGMVAWLIAAAALVATCVVLGRRAAR
jgi:ubiquinol-cytochrome c reductase cytochrome c subunit